MSYSLSESGHDTKVSWLTGKALSHKANIIASKSYNTQTDYRFDMKTFMELRNALSVVVAYDGVNPTAPVFCYLKPHYNDPNDSYFVQLAKDNSNEWIRNDPAVFETIEHLILDDSVSEVMVNGPDHVFIENRASCNKYRTYLSASDPSWSP